MKCALAIIRYSGNGGVCGYSEIKKGKLKDLIKFSPKINDENDYIIYKEDDKKPKAFNRFYEDLGANMRGWVKYFDYWKKKIIYSSIPDKKHGDFMTLLDFISQVKDRNLIDYDGYGKLATKKKMSNITIRPSDVLKGKMILPKFTHIVWFNR